MTSQKSSAVLPKQSRGRARVEALLDAATLVFVERGYDQATMTEIAARSATAIGSLYRFFPTKEALGETLLQRFAERSAAAFEELAGRAATLDAEAVAATLIEITAEIKAGDRRSGALAVLEGRRDGAAIRTTYRDGLRRQIAQVLRSANPRLGKERAATRAAVLLYLLKGEHLFARQDPVAAPVWSEELHRLVRHYVADALSEC